MTRYTGDVVGVDGLTGAVHGDPKRVRECGRESQIIRSSGGCRSGTDAKSEGCRRVRFFILDSESDRGLAPFLRWVGGGKEQG